MTATNRALGRCFFGLSLIALGVVVAAASGGWTDVTAPATISLCAALAVAFMTHAALRGAAFTIWVLAFVATAMFYPAAFGRWFGKDLVILIVPLIQVIMFGMGTTLSVKDFTRVLAMPWPVCVGMVLQFAVMPLAGMTIAKAFGFEPEIAAGVILIGSVPGGVASNVMTYLARGDVPLSVTMTACSTLLSPVMTPLLMKVLAGRLVPIDVGEMMLSILNMIIMPTVAGLLANRILYSQGKWFRQARFVALIAAASAGAVVVVAAVNERVLQAVLSPSVGNALLTLRGGLLIGLALVAAVALAKLLVSMLLRGPENWMDKALPVVSMIGICVIIGIITSRSREQLLTVGLALIAAAVLHNTTGYVLGYWGGKLLGLNGTACRTVAIEVGLQNGGMASGLAIHVLQSPSAALAPAIFGPWMNVSGSILASWWHHRPVQGQAAGRDSRDDPGAGAAGAIHTARLDGAERTTTK